jgi:hypothetical protein
MSLQLEVGKTYKDREGNLVTITDKTDYDCPYPYFCNGNQSTYMSDGRFREYHTYHDYDLVEEVLSMQMFSSTWAFPNFKQVKEETKMQDQITTLLCTLTVCDADGELHLEVYPPDQAWRESSTLTVLDASFELVLSKAKIEELYTARLLATVQKADQDYKEALEAFETAKDFIDNL